MSAIRRWFFRDATGRALFEETRQLSPLCLTLSILASVGWLLDEPITSVRAAVAAGIGLANFGFRLLDRVVSFPWLHALWYPALMAAALSLAMQLSVAQACQVMSIFGLVLHGLLLLSHAWIERSDAKGQAVSGQRSWLRVPY